MVSVTTLPFIILAGFAIFLAGVGITISIAMRLYYVDNSKDAAVSYFSLGAVSLMPVIIYLICLLKRFTNFAT